MGNNDPKERELFRWICETLELEGFQRDRDKYVIIQVPLCGSELDESNYSAIQFFLEKTVGISFDVDSPVRGMKTATIDIDTASVAAMLDVVNLTESLKEYTILNEEDYDFRRRKFVRETWDTISEKEKRELLVSSEIDPDLWEKELVDLESLGTGELWFFLEEGFE